MFGNIITLHKHIRRKIVPESLDPTSLFGFLPTNGGLLATAGLAPVMEGLTEYAVAAGVGDA